MARRRLPSSNVYLVLIVLALVAALAIGYAIGRQRRGGRDEPVVTLAPPVPPDASAVVAGLRRDIARRDAALTQFAAFTRDREQLLRALSDARGETARYRQLVVDLEDNAPPPLLGGPGAPDDLKLIVGVGPMLERMLYQLGVTTYRQIARWTDRDIDEFDARLPEFPGRIRRDAWVTQARALYQSKYGEPVPPRDRA